MTSLRPLHRFEPHNSEVVACDIFIFIFATSNSLKSHVARNLKSPFSNMHAVPFKLYPHTRPTTVQIAPRLTTEQPHRPSPAHGPADHKNASPLTRTVILTVLPILAADLSCGPPTGKSP
jgi:hypothetical protein